MHTNCYCRLPLLSFPSHSSSSSEFPPKFFPAKTHKKPIFSSSSSPFHTSKEPNSLELLGKPPHISPPTEEEEEEVQVEEEQEALAPFLKFFKSREELESSQPHPPPPPRQPSLGDDDDSGGVEYYDPKPGDLVVGVVVSGNENKMDVAVGADFLGTMLTKEAMPMYQGEMESLLWGGEGELGRGRMGVVREEDALGTGEGRRVPGRPVVEAGEVVFAEVLGRTLSGRPLLSSRRLYRRVAWHRVRQIKQLNEPIEVKIFEWNTGGLLTRIEGLRAFLPKAELTNRVNNFMDLKDNVGRRLFVSIVRIDEATNDLIVSEKDAWDKLYLKEGTLLEGTIRKIFPYGAQVRIGKTNRSGLLHISNITRARISSVSDLLKVEEKVKVLVVKSMFPDKISLSIADLESEPGLFLSNKEKVFEEAEEMAKRYKQRLPVIPVKSEPSPTEVLPFDDEARMYANWKWFKFEQHKEVESNK
ncbi:Uncharacterized protein M6B38_230110 [Iris pallida]|uniref:S1 motif domain-containing protein n=1 Tax=Iris pallida TaxID=29817 RepID=A0AAX6DSD1_IRIPA|nr:Uncharacterized protein M6B38_230110 [Iris pallida]